MLSHKTTLWLGTAAGFLALAASAPASAPHAAPAGSALAPLGEPDPRQPLPPEQPEPRGPCACEDLEAKISRVNSHSHNRAGTHVWGFKLTWTLACTEGDGGCTGEASIGGPSRGRIVGSLGASTKIECKANCGATKSGLRYFNVITKGRGPFTVKFDVTTRCEQTTKTFTVTLRFNKAGWLEDRLSDLDGDGKPDK